MGFYGDLREPVYWFTSDSFNFLPMSTAIVRIYTSEGFVLAADGRHRKKKGTLITDSAQKLFPVQPVGSFIGYALAGTVGITDEAENLVFEFVSETARAVQDVSARRPAELQRYAGFVGRFLNKRFEKSISDARASGRKVQYPDNPEDNSALGSPIERGTTIVRLFFAGYYEGLPSWTHVRFYHVNQKLAFPGLGVASVPHTA